MFSGRCEISINAWNGLLFAGYPSSTRPRRNAEVKRLRVLEKDTRSIVEEEEFRKRVDALERDFESDAYAGFVPAHSLDSVPKEIESARNGDAYTSNESDSWLRALEDFTIPFDYFHPFVYTAVASTALGLYQSFQGAPNMDGFSVENLVHFQLPIQAALFAAVFLQSVAGWGFALAAMTGVSMVGPGLTMTEAQALVGLVAIPVDAFMFYPYLESKKFDRKVVDKWVVGAMIATPIGVAALECIDEKSALVGLGASILAYCGYAVFNILQCYHSKSKKTNPRELALNGVNSYNGSTEILSNGNETGGDKSCNAPKKYPVLGTWAAGLVAGMSGGAFDVPGPPLVVFADLTEMAASAELTRANLLAFFALDAQLVAFSDLVDGRFDVPFLWPTMVLAIPSLLAANAAGSWCGKFIDQEKFRWLVISLLGVCGLHQVGAF